MFKILDIEEDMAGKFRVKIEYEDNILYFKFQTLPDQNLIEQTINNYIQLKLNIDKDTIN
jgi:hypothetical protein